MSSAPPLNKSLIGQNKMAETTSSIEGPKVLLIGAAGSGKTRSLATFADWASRQSLPRRVIVLFTENSLETFLGFWRDRQLEVPGNIHWHVVKTKALPFDSLVKGADMVGKLAYKAITEMVDPMKGQNNPYLKIMQVLAKFTDDRTGEDLGSISDWSSNDIFMLDSLSELANACMKMVIGNKPTASPSDYGVAQNNLLNFLRFITQGFPPTLVMTAHVQRQQDEITGGVKLMTKAIGKAMGDDIPQLFSEVIGCVRDGTNWYWDTANSSLDTKTRYLPIQSKISPDGAQIMDKWLNRSKV